MHIQLSANVIFGNVSPMAISFGCCVDESQIEYRLIYYSSSLSYAQRYIGFIRAECILSKPCKCIFPPFLLKLSVNMCFTTVSTTGHCCAHAERYVAKIHGNATLQISFNTIRTE